MWRKVVLLFIISCLKFSVAYNTTDVMDASSVMTMIGRKSRANLVSFEPLGEHIQIGLDFLLPFIKVPIVRKVDVYGNEPALININTAALISTGLLATTSALISYIFRRYVVLGREETSSERRRRSENDLEYELWSILNNFKLVYTNSSGAKVDTSLAGLFGTINETFEQNDIDLRSCVQKTICSRIQLSARRVNEGDSSAVDKIIDGLMGIKTLRNFLRHTALKDAFDARDVASFSTQQQQYNDKQPVYCEHKYPQCKWSLPEDNLLDIITTYLKFT